MQTKTIKKILKNKLDAWCDSISDESVRKAIKRGAIVTGGSIASMLLKEDINDFDIYFKNKEDLKIVAKYYSKGLELMDGDKEQYTKELASIEAPIEEFGGFQNGEEDEVKDYSSQRYIALKNLEAGRLKFYTSGKDFGIKKEDQSKGEYKVSFISPNAISLTDKVQIVIRFYGDIETIHKNYDFIHATNSYDYENNELHLKKDALESLLSKTLYYQGSKYPVTSVIRSKKFIKRNWNISAGEYLKMLFQVSALDLSNPEVLEEQLIGVDIAYFSAVISALRNMDNKKVDSATLITIINKIFN